MRSGHLNNTLVKCTFANAVERARHLAERFRLALTPSSVEKATGKVTL
jgi:hypothetical protein